MVIFFIPDDGAGTVNLLRQNQPDQLMRKSKLRKANCGET